MPQQHDHLFDRIANFQALHRAARHAIKGKRKKPGAAAFFANLERELLTLERQLRDGGYRPGRYTVIEVNAPKKRLVSAASRRGRRADRRLGGARATCRYVALAPCDLPGRPVRSGPYSGGLDGPL